MLKEHVEVLQKQLESAQLTKEHTLAAHAKACGEVISLIHQIEMVGCNTKTVEQVKAEEEAPVTKSFDAERVKSLKAAAKKVVAKKKRRSFAKVAAEQPAKKGWP